MASTLKKLLTGLCLTAFTLTAVVFVSSCIKEDKFVNTVEGNFKALWKIIDEHYCFLDYKNIDWDAVGKKYEAYLSKDMANENLFEVLGNMLSELKDGHVNLYNSANISRYWDYYEDYPRNFSEEIQEKYLGQGYRISSGMKYTILDDNIGYIALSSFSNAIGEGNLNQILKYLEICNGLIIDVRNNGGGDMTNATLLAERFTNEKKLIGYIMHKTGKGHNDFSSPNAMYIHPADGIRWQKPAAILTNRHSFSATNYFVNCMRYCDQVKIIGDQTGGGSGLPYTYELPNGWGVRFSASPMLDAGKNHIEFGIEPDIACSMKEEDALKGVDTIIETARKILIEK